MSDSDSSPLPHITAEAASQVRGQPVTGVRFFQVATGVSDWTAEERLWLQFTPDMIRIEQEAREAMKRIEIEYPEMFNFLKREYGKMLDRQVSSGKTFPGR